MIVLYVTYLLLSSANCLFFVFFSTWSSTDTYLSHTGRERTKARKTQRKLLLAKNSHFFTSFLENDRSQLVWFEGLLFFCFLFFFVTGRWHENIKKTSMLGVNGWGWMRTFKVRSTSLLPWLLEGRGAFLSSHFRTGVICSLVRLSAAHCLFFLNPMW